MGDKDDLAKPAQQLSTASPHIKFVLEPGVGHEWLHEKDGTECLAKISAYIDEALVDVTATE